MDKFFLIAIESILMAQCPEVNVMNYPCVLQKQKPEARKSQNTASPFTISINLISLQTNELHNTIFFPLTHINFCQSMSKLMKMAEKLWIVYLAFLLQNLHLK